MKINCYGGFKKENGCAGIGVVVRNCEGRLINGVCDVVVVDSPLVVEALVARKGVKLAIECFKKWK